MGKYVLSREIHVFVMNARINLWDMELLVKMYSFKIHFSDQYFELTMCNSSKVYVKIKTKLRQNCFT